MINSTAILIFANSGVKEQKLKPFHNSKALFKKLNQEVILKAKNSGLPYFHISENEQEGDSFGARYTNAIKSIFDKGFTHVIVVGNDTPHLKTSQLTKTAALLTKQSLVLGPSIDGGFYLMGLSKSQFNQQDFLKLPWQTAHLTRCILSLICKRNTRAIFLETLQDLDTISDIKKLVYSLKKVSTSVQKLLFSIVNWSKTIFSTYNSFYSSYYKTNYYNKGSPNYL